MPSEEPGESARSSSPGGRTRSNSGKIWLIWGQIRLCPAHVRSILSTKRLRRVFWDLTLLALLSLSQIPWRICSGSRHRRHLSGSVRGCTCKTGPSSPLSLCWIASAPSPPCFRPPSTFESPRERRAAHVFPRGLTAPRCRLNLAASVFGCPPPRGRPNRVGRLKACLAPPTRGASAQEVSFSKRFVPPFGATTGENKIGRYESLRGFAHLRRSQGPLHANPPKPFRGDARYLHTRGFPL